MNTTNSLSTPELIRLIGQRFRDYRLRVNMTQKEVAEKAGLSVITVSKFEGGQSINLSISSLAMMLRAIGCIDKLAELLPELPPSPYMQTTQGANKQRVKHNKP